MRVRSLVIAASFYFASLPIGAQAQPASGPEIRLQSLNQELVRLSSQPRDVVLNRARDILRLRVTALRELAQTDPARALALTLSEPTLARLRGFAPDVAANLESESEWSGPALVVAEDDFVHNTSRNHVSVQISGEWVEVYGAPASSRLTSGTVIGGRGIRVGPMILAHSVSPLTSSVLAPLTASGCSTIGVQRLAIVMVNFASSSINTSILNAATLNAQVNGGGHSLSGFWNEASYGQTSAVADVYGPFNLGANYTSADYTNIQNAAIAAAATLGGVNFNNYDHVVIIMPNGFPVGGGLGTVGCTQLTSPTTGAFTAGVVWLRADFMTPNDAGVCGLVHENGHNLGLDHASTETYGSPGSTIPLGQLGDVPTHVEYGNYFSLMGSCNTYNNTTLLGHYDAQHKVTLGWFAPANYQTVSSPGTFTLAPTEIPSSGLQAIRVKRGSTNFYLWLEYRKMAGYDSTFTALNGQIYSGAMIHFEDPSDTTYAGHTRLLNFTAPANPDFSQPALAAGQSWSDPASLLTLNVTGLDSAGLHVAVQYDTPCATFSPGSRNYASYAAVAADTFAVTISGVCTWLPISNAPWIHTSGPVRGLSGTVTYSLDANTTPFPRTGSITVDRQQFTITQASSNPQPTPVAASPVNSAAAPGTPKTFTFTFSDGDGAADLSQVNVLFNSSTSVAHGCNLTWYKSDNTLRLSDDAGDGGYTYWYANQATSLTNSQCQVNYSNAVTTSGNTLTLTLTVTFTNSFAGLKNVYLQAQDALGADSGPVLEGTWLVGNPACTYTLPVTSAGVGSAGGSGILIAVSTQAGCPWTAVSNAAWIHVTAGSAGTGPGNVTVSINANTGPLALSGTLTIGGLTYTLVQQPPVGTNNEAFVRQLYLDILSRTGDTAGVNAWTNWINTGVYTRAQVASQFFQSAEFSVSGSYITRLYLAIMLRDPDYGGWTGWFDYLHAGHSQTEILNQFLGSLEFQSRYGTLDNTGFVTLLYNNILNRTPDTAGLTQWVAWLNTGTLTRAQVTDQFVGSLEFVTNTKNRVYANMLYIGFLRRAGELAGLNGWTNWLNNGTYTLDQVVNGFITSPEYLSRF